MKWKKGTLALIAGAFAATLLMSGCGQTRIGYVDSERLMKESPQIQSLVDEGNQKMEEEGKKIDADLSEKKGQLSDEDLCQGGSQGPSAHGRPAAELHGADPAEGECGT
jgi:outer membrane protein